MRSVWTTHHCFATAAVAYGTVSVAIHFGCRSLPQVFHLHRKSQECGMAISNQSYSCRAASLRRAKAVPSHTPHTPPKDPVSTHSTRMSRLRRRCAIFFGTIRRVFAMLSMFTCSPASTHTRITTILTTTSSSPTSHHGSRNHSRRAHA
jgi:hypothetical protein